MLKTLSIRNVVLIDKLDLDFADMLNVLTGETGAGKSILLDSLGLLLGFRADTGLIRNGADKLTVSGVFELRDAQNPFFELCAENDVDLEDGPIIVKRSLSRDGKGKILLNDQPVTQRFLKEAGAYLVEIHGQFDNQGLLNPATHLSVLDRYGVAAQELENLKRAYRTFKTTEKNLEEAERAFREASQDEDNLRHWIDELQKADVKQGEEDALNRQRALMMQSEKIIENFNTAYNALHDRDIGGLLQKAQSAVDRINHLTENRYAEIAEALETALIQFDEALNLIEQASGEVETNSEQADQVEERLFALKALARKHQTVIDELPNVLAQMKQKLQEIDTGGSRIVSLQKELKEARQIYLQQAEAVSKMRRQAADVLDAGVMKELPPLKMERAVFKTEFSKLAETQWSEKGIDGVCFSVATNPNSPQGPLNKIASGGELSRLMLALKVNLAQKSSVETLVFDEIDSGIGGATAQAVGERLSRLSRAVQVLVVTHAPQVAAFGDCNFKVGKSTTDQTTTTNVRMLNRTEKVEEIARMLSGENITTEARAAAEALMTQSQTTSIFSN
jgi:DNA repair protein RecN (Recombination protein N)